MKILVFQKTQLLLKLIFRVTELQEKTNLVYIKKVYLGFLGVSILGFSMECFTAGYSRFSSTAFKICVLGESLGTCYQFQALEGFPCNFLIS